MGWEDDDEDDESENEPPGARAVQARHGQTTPTHDRFVDELQLVGVRSHACHSESADGKWRETMRAHSCEILRFEAKNINELLERK